LLRDSIVSGVTQVSHLHMHAGRGMPGHTRAEGESLVNRYHPPAANATSAAALAGTAITLAASPFEAEADFLHRDVFHLPAHGTSVAAARNRVGERLRQWGVDEPVHDDVALVVSELFTNALVHTDSAEIICRLQTTEQIVYLAVTDQGHGPTGPEIREPDTESGRGLLLVSALTELWGVSTEYGRGRTVWAILPSCAEDAES
jgi:anti-sigma regulatory factor (Ser/Thr protein kinase)